jgi:curved DNA-binding protein CbpA
MAQNYYQILGVSAKAEFPEIKTAFRRRIKEHHPDTKDPNHPELFTIHDILEAYEVLSDPDQRVAYNHQIRYTPEKTDFNYRHFLQSRPDDKSQAKLVFYDILRKREHEAVELYNQLSERRTFSLEQSLGKEDFMDCAFLLAEEMEKAQDYAQAVYLHLRLAELEQDRPYFKHFFVEVEDRLRNLLTRKVSWEIPVKQRIVILESLIKMNFSPKNQLAILKKLIELYLDVGILELAREKYSKAYAMAPKDKALAKIRDKLD